MFSKEYEFSKIYNVSNVLEVVKAINGNEDWSMKNFVVDILVASKGIFVFFWLPLPVLVIYLETLITLAFLPLNFAWIMVRILFRLIIFRVSLASWTF